MNASRSKIGMLHYTAPPVVGGVEAVIQAHAWTFLQAGYEVAIVAGRGEPTALPEGAALVPVPEIDSRHPPIAQMGPSLEEGEVPAEFDRWRDRLVEQLEPTVSQYDDLIVHNVFTKHFNLPLTAALHRLLDDGVIRHCIAWCHDFTWTSPSSGHKVHPGYPWDLLRTYRPDVTYVVVSERRQQALASLFDVPPENVHVVYNGVDPHELLGLSDEGSALADRLDLWASDLILLMPVRVTQAKNIEFALRVVAALKARDYRPKLILTGPPDPHSAQSMAYFESLRALRRELDVEEEMRFVFESGPHPDEPYTIDTQVVGDLFRASDVVFMPSHREGFGMPVLEAGLVGVPMVCTPVPAAVEIGGPDVTVFDREESPAAVAERMVSWAEQSPAHRLRRRVRQRYTWTALLEREIGPLLADGGGM